MLNLRHPSQRMKRPPARPRQATSTVRNVSSQERVLWDP